MTSIPAVSRGDVVKETLICVRDGRVVQGLRVGEEREGARILSQHVARVEAGRKNLLVDLDVDGKMILKWI
jgi:hypothetical protein